MPRANEKTKKTATKADRAAYKALPYLQAFCRRYKREAVRDLTRKVEAATSPRMRAYLLEHLGRVKALPPIAFRSAVIGDLVADIKRQRLWYLEQSLAVHPSIDPILGRRFVRLSA